MPLSMKDLMNATGESKSTIHFYLKEGLLPEPLKPKPNVHHYDKSCINIIKLIKHLQNDFSYSISEIKSVFERNNFDFNGSFDILINSLNIISGSKDNKWFSKEDILELTSISEDKLKEYLNYEFIYQKPKGFTTKEIEMIDILLKIEESDLDINLIHSYVQKAKELANLEYEIGAKLLLSNEKEHNKHYELLFNIVLSLKPYIFNTQTINTHQTRITMGGK